MKTKITIAALLLSAVMFAQKPSVAVLNIDSKGVISDPQETGYLVRLELEKTGKVTVMDKYEVADVLTANKIDANTCYAKTCLVETGKLLKVDKMLTGSVERMGEKIIITLRLIDVQSGAVEKSDATEYLNLPEVQKMIAISVRKIMGMEPDPVMTKLLIDYDVPIESPKNTLCLNGPRMGFGMATGPALKVLTEKDGTKGGFNMYPVNFQFGWQQEFQYISAGNFQALVENLFVVSGLESGRFIPSYTPLLGFRFGKGNGAWEFGFGPTFRLVKKANGFYDNYGDMKNGQKGDWHLNSEWNTTNVKDTVVAPHALRANPNPSTTRLDSRGSVELSTGLVIAVGKTFRSGYLNIPVNVYVAPRKDGTTVGVMMGFNIQKKKRVE